MAVVTSALCSALTAVAATESYQINTSTRSEQVTERTPLGELAIPGKGMVRLLARRRGSTVLVWAIDQSGQTLGRAETVAGTHQSPLHIRVGDELKRIVIYWASSE